jgi:tryptophan 2,3-dioxygenase
MTEPISRFAGGSTPYADYQQLATLLSIQETRSDSPDEPLFLTVAQAMELMFKVTRDEAARVRGFVTEDDLGAATELIERVKRLLLALTACWDIHATITPAGYLGFRHILLEGSGFQSPSYRRLEFVLGNKQPALAEVHRGTAFWPVVEADLRSPSLWDEVHRLLARRGLLPADAEVLRRDPAVPQEPSGEIEALWLERYRAGAPADLLRFADRLVDLASTFHDFRQRHLVTVERLMGHRPGTGGTSGVPWLRRIADHRFFPELWSVRTLL